MEWLSKILDILGGLTYIAMLLYSIRLSFRETFRIFLLVVLVSILIGIVYRIFKHFLIKEYLITIEIGIIMISAGIFIWLLLPLVNSIINAIGDIKVKAINRLISFIIGIVISPILIGYLLIFSSIVPKLYNILELSSVLKVFENISKLIVGITIV